MACKAVNFAAAVTLALVGVMSYRSYVGPVAIARWVVYGQSNDGVEGVGELIISERGSLLWEHIGRGFETAGPITQAWWRLASPIHVKNPDDDIPTQERNRRLLDQWLDELVRVGEQIDHPSPVGHTRECQCFGNAPWLGNG